jgi:hypothetical protein
MLIYWVLAALKGFKTVANAFAKFINSNKGFAYLYPNSFSNLDSYTIVSSVDIKLINLALILLNITNSCFLNF